MTDVPADGFAIEQLAAGCHGGRTGIVQHGKGRRFRAAIAGRRHASLIVSSAKKDTRMPIGVKATFNYSATAATTNAWTLTASTSVAVGDVLVLTAAYRGSASHSISAIGDNAGNGWSRAIEQSSVGFTSAIWYAPVSTTTAGFKIAIGLLDGRTVSARAAHILVLTGVDPLLPVDAGTARQMALVSSSATTATLSTSAATALPNEILVVSASQNSIDSATSNAAAGWLLRGNAIAAQGNVSLKKYLWTYSASSTGVYQFSASLSNGGSARTRQFQIAGFRPAADGATSATVTVDFGSASSLSARGELQAEGAATFSPVGTPRGVANASGQAAIFLGAAGLPGLAGDISGAAGMAFVATANGTSGGVPALPPSDTTATLLGGGWDRRLFRRLLDGHERRSRLQGRELEASAALDDARVDPSDGTGLSVAAAVNAMDVSSALQQARLTEQALSVIGLDRALASIGASIEQEWQEREAEAMLLLAA